MVEKESANLGWKPIAVVAIVIIGAISGFIVYDEIINKDFEPEGVSATVIIDFGNGNTEWYNVTTVNNSAVGFLEVSLGAGNYSLSNSFDAVSNYDFVSSIQNVENNATVPGLDDTKDRWWRYYVNDGLGWYSPIQNGEILKFSFEVTDKPSVMYEEIGRTIGIVIDFGNNTRINRTVISNNYTVLGILESVVGPGNLDLTYYHGMGYLVNGIDDVKNGAAVAGIGDTSNYYWQYYVNDELPFVAADRYILENEDNLLWIFEEIVW